MLQDMCPRCGLEWVTDAVLCPACGFDRVGRGVEEVDGIRREIHLSQMAVAGLGLATLAMVIVAFRAGWQLHSSPPAPDMPAQVATASPDDLIRAPTTIGRVLFAERLGESLELESYRTEFRHTDTIAWRAEFLEPPPTAELTIVIAWQSIRERMQLSEETLIRGDPRLTIVARDEVPLDDLVPTAGLYSVAYFAGDLKLAEGIFEVLPPER